MYRENYDTGSDATDNLPHSNDEKKTKDIINKFFQLYNEGTLLGNRLLSVPKEIEGTPLWNLKLNAIQTNTMWVVSIGKCLTMSQLADKQGMHRQAITKYVLSLVKLGILRRFQKENNYKNVYIELTDYGKKILEDTNKITNKHFIDKFTSVMSFEEIQEFVSVCEKKNEFLKRLE